ncbi:MAG: hypothetical protein LBC19_07355 [Tannerella sp.]|jgi:hypothetical protein|nr:hypothetical protein [Tannerella sp.]
MDKVKHFLLVITILAFSGCDDENFNTSHPDEGGIILTTEWPDNENATQTYRARIITPSGFIRDFDGLSGGTNTLVVNPGDAALYVYNHAENITVFGNIATVTGAGAGTAAYPGSFFSSFGQVYTQQDRDVRHTAPMCRQTGELKLSLAIKPAAMINRVKAVRATLEGVASELNMQTNALSAPSSVSFPLSKNSFYATAILRLLGFEPSTRPGLTLDIELDDGYAASITHDLSSLVKDFNGSKSNLFTLNANMLISGENSITVDNWESNTESRYLSVSTTEVNLPESNAEESVIITTDQPSWEYSIIKTGDWITVDKTNTQLNISVSENTDKNSRLATVNISAGGFGESITVTQSGYAIKSYSDKEVVKLQSATVGNGVNLVMTGDGYTSKDMVKSSGKYEQDMRAATEHFFSVYPYTEYRDYFNVYMVVAVSNEEGISVESTNTTVDTKFGTRWEGGSSTGIDCNEYVVIEYLDEISELATVDINDITVIMPINANIYAGTCGMYYSGNSVTDFGNGFSISMCPVGRSFKEVVVHEAGGHGFAKLMDEYVYYQKETIPDDEKDLYNEYKTRYGWCENIDFYNDILLTSWKDFAGKPKYSMVDIFEGACMYGKGIWRPEYNSCMNNNVLYFNAPSRWAQVRRIKKLAGFSYSLSQFLQEDIVPEYPSDVRSGVEDKNFIPLASPVIKFGMDIGERRSKSKR